MTTLAVQITWTRVPDPDEECIIMVGFMLPPSIYVKFPNETHMDVPPNIVSQILEQTVSIIDKQYNRIGKGRVVTP